MPDYLTPEEQQAIEAAVEAGKVKKVNPGTSFEGYIWCPKRNQIINKVPKRWDNNIFHSRDRLAAENRRKRIVALAKQGKTISQIEIATGHTKDTIKRHLETARVSAAKGKTGSPKIAEEGKARRAQVLDIMRADPGLTGREVAKRIHVSIGRAQAILAELRKEGVIPRPSA